MKRCRPLQIGLGLGQFHHHTPRHHLPAKIIYVGEEKIISKPEKGKGKTYFRIKDLKEYLVKHRFTDMETNRIASKLRDLKAEHKFWNIKGRGTNVWYIKEFKYDGEDTSLETKNFTESSL